MSNEILGRFLTGLGFSYGKNTAQPIISERPDLVQERATYLTRMEEARRRGSCLVFMDETWVFDSMTKEGKYAVTTIRTWNCYSTAACRASTVFSDKNEIAFPIHEKEPKHVEIKDAFGKIKSGDNIFIHGIAATPTPLLKGLCEHAKANNLKGIKLHHLHLEGETPWTAPDMKDRIRSNSLFTGTNLRKAVNEGIADFNSCFLQEVLMLFRRGAIKVNAAIIHAIHPGKLVVGFVYGSTKLYDFLSDNPLVEFGDIQWVNDPAIIRQNPKVTAINAAVEIDLTGQGESLRMLYVLLS
ncbi:unnamed protein product [Cylicocyclus nassatus]|uniref:Uncharacterized protein n=1 Tax=Cylicocyclus nassatus TaxID=53992 RepID=A0AA36GGK1_CYLNA|nr:unnamed protein product [Cylicocyclus nassatus]